MSKLLFSPLIANNCKPLLFRNYAFKSDLKIQWNKPKKVSSIRASKSGDLANLPNFNSIANLPVNFFQHSKELETADESVRKLFTLGFNRRNKVVEHCRIAMTNEVKRHVLDSGSMESKLAAMTVRIRNLQQIVLRQSHNGQLIEQLKHLIDKRKKFLKYLRRWDYRRFEWILEKLDLKYVPEPEELTMVTRRGSLRKLTDLHCENIQNERLAEYRKELESHQIDFLTRKLNNLQFIRSEQIDCKFPVTVSSEQIQEVQKQLKVLQTKRSGSPKTDAPPPEIRAAAARN